MIPVLCNFQVNYSRKRKEHKKSERRNEETEKKLCRVAQTKAISPKRELGSPFSPKRRRISPKQELVQ